MECLLTKLKGSASGDLPYNGEFRIHVKEINEPTANTQTMSLGIVGEHKIWTTNGGTFKVDDGESVSEATVGNLGRTNIELFFDNGTYDVIISDKYSIQMVGFSRGGNNLKSYSFDISQLNYSDILSLYTSGITMEGEFKPLKPAQLTTVALNSMNAGAIGIQFEYFVNLANIEGATNMEIFEARDTKCYGNILSFAASTNLRAIVLAYCDDIQGEIRDLAAAQVLYGRTSGVLEVGCIPSSVTDNGNIVTHEYLISKGGAWNVWIKYDPTAPNGYTIHYTNPGQ